MSQKKTILDYLNKEYSIAKSNDNTEMMHRLLRAIIAFSYNNFEAELNWDDMVAEYYE